MMKCTQYIYHKYHKYNKEKQLHKESKLDLKQLNKGNRVQEKFKARMTQGNRKHKKFVSRFEPPL